MCQDWHLTCHVKYRGEVSPPTISDDLTNPARNKNGILLRLENTVNTTLKVVLPDICFCILYELIDLRKVWVLSAALIKNHRYYPMYVPEKQIDKYKKTEEIGDVTSLHGELDD